MGTAEQLTSLIEFACDQMSQSYASMGLLTPPWRSVRCMLALWQCSRTSSSGSAASSSSASAHARAGHGATSRRQNGTAAHAPGLGHERLERQACRQQTFSSRASQAQGRQLAAALTAAIPAPKAPNHSGAAATQQQQQQAVARVAWVRSPTAVAVGERIRACGNSAWGARR